MVTGLIWLQDTDCGGLRDSWAEASRLVAALADGTCGLSDGSSAGDWRVPTRAEFEALGRADCTGFTMSDATGTTCVLDGETPFTLPPPNQATFVTSDLASNLDNFVVANFGNFTFFEYPRATSSPVPGVWPVRSP